MCLSGNKSSLPIAGYIVGPQALVQLIKLLVEDQGSSAVVEAIWYLCIQNYIKKNLITSRKKKGYLFISYLDFS